MQKSSLICLSLSAAKRLRISIFPEKQVTCALPIHHFKFFQDAISLFIEILTNGLIVWSKSFPMHFAPFFQAAVIFALFESVVCADLIERNNRYFCITDDTRRRKTSIYGAVYCNSYSLYGNIPPTSFLQSFRLPPLCLHKS